MHGIIHSKLNNFVVENFGPEAWDKVMSKAELQDKFYLLGEPYPDEDAIKIVTVASELTGLTVNELLEDFGRFIVPSLLTLYDVLINKEWRTEELLLNAENTIHSVVRIKNKGATPPELHFERIQPGLLKFVYTSRRQMHPVAVGIMKAIAEHFGEQIIISVTKQSPDMVEMNVNIKARGIYLEL